MASIAKLGKGKQPPRAIDFVYPEGKRNRVRLGIVSHDTAEECRRQIEKLIESRSTNQAPSLPTLTWLNGLSDVIHERLARFGLCEPRVPVDAAPTLGEWLTKYLDQRKSELKPGSLQRLSQTADHLRAFFGNETRLDELTPNGAADWRAALLAEKKPARRGEKLKSGEEQKPLRCEATARNYTRDAKTIFNAAVDRELIAKNPFAKLKSSVLAANRTRYVSPEESQAILEAAPNAHPWRLLFGLARFAGLRTPSETHRLTWADVDWERRRLSVYAPKTDSNRIVPITADLFPILQAAFDAAPEGTVNIVQLGSHRSNLHRGLEKIILRAGLVPWDDLFQTLRSCAETDFARKYPQHEVSRWIGHSIAVSEKHYLMSDSSVMDNASSAPPLLRAAESAAVSSGNSTQVQETRRNDEETVVMLARSKECEKPLKTGAFRDSKGGTRTRDPRLMKPVL